MINTYDPKIHTRHLQLLLELQLYVTRIIARVGRSKHHINYMYHLYYFLSYISNNRLDYDKLNVLLKCRNIFLLCTKHLCFGTMRINI